MRLTSNAVPMGATVLLRAALAVAVLGLAACPEEPTPPEQRIRELNARAEAAAEARDVAALKDMVAEDYRDVSGYDKQAVVRLVQLYLLRNRAVHLFTLTKSLQILDQDHAVADILVAMAGQPVEEVDQLFDIRADLMRFNVRYVRDDDEWRVIGVEWRRATADDFL